MVVILRSRVLQVGQQAVALSPADGEYISGSTQSNFLGDGFYTRNGFTKAAAWTGPNPVGADFTGFDDLHFFPIGTWLTDFGGTGFYTRMDDLGLNGMAPCAGSISLANNVTFEKWAIVYSGDHAGGTISAGDDPCVVGVNSGDEPSTIVQYDSEMSAINTWLGSSDGAGRFAYLPYFGNVLNGEIESHYFPDDMVLGRNDTFTNPPVSFGAWCSYDIYCFAGATAAGSSILDQLHFWLYSTAGSATPNECARGSNYGSMVDAVRKHYPANDRRIHWPPIEDGAPYTEADSAAITPTQLQWAVWATLVHGARLINYFNHTFRTGDPLNTNNVLNNDGYGGPGIQGTGIYAAVKEINLRVLALAPVLNSPFDGYFVYGDTAQISTTGFLTAVTSTNARARYAGVDASCRWYPTESKHYILATTRESESATSIPVTFRMVDQGQTQAHEMHEADNIAITRGGGIPAGFCEFSDTFATAATYKTYRID
jgi:hypothetical protein